MARPLIALVDDDGPTIGLLRELLTDEGYQTICCLSGDEALAAIQREKPDLIILDIRLEHPLSGWTVLEALRREPATKNIPVLLCSADSQFLREQEQNIRALHSDSIEKPFDVDRLLRKVYAAVGPPSLREYEV